VLDKNLENSGIESPALINLLGSYLFVGIIFLILFIFANVAIICAIKYRVKIKAKLKEEIKKFF
jgi:hypothetical protein